ncbi:AarF/ABC1/UbiB kinase family protein, partial [Streptomyces olivaceus]
MTSVVGDRLRLVVKVLGSLVADEVGQATRLRRRARRDTRPPAEDSDSAAGGDGTPGRAAQRP